MMKIFIPNRDNFNISFHYIRAQPIALWNKTYGGSSFDIGRSIINSTNGGYILAGYTASQDGNIFGARGGNDFFGLLSWATLVIYNGRKT